MPLHAIRSRSLSEQVFEQLAAEIITGRYAPGSHLPAERALTEVFDVNRHVVREALKRLEQIGLVKVSQGGGTKVLDFQRHAGLDLLAIMSEHARGGENVATIWLAVLEMQAAITADLARLCAERATPELKRELVALAEDMRAKSDTATDQELFRLDVVFWERLADGANNIAYRLAVNTMVRAAAAKGPLAEHWTSYQLRRSEFRIPVATAIAAGDPTRAETATRDSMRGAATHFATTIGQGPPAPKSEAKPVEPPPPSPRPKRSKAARET